MTLTDGLSSNYRCHFLEDQPELYDCEAGETPDRAGVGAGTDGAVQTLEGTCRVRGSREEQRGVNRRRYERSQWQCRALHPITTACLSSYVFTAKLNPLVVQAHPTCPVCEHARTALAAGEATVCVSGKWCCCWSQRDLSISRWSTWGSLASSHLSGRGLCS